MCLSVNETDPDAVAAAQLTRRPATCRYINPWAAGVDSSPALEDDRFISDPIHRPSDLGPSDGYSGSGGGIDSAAERVAVKSAYWAG